MKQVDYWRWRLKAQTHGGAVYNSRHVMTEAQALAQDPGAVRIPGTHQVIEVADTDEELAARAPTTRIHMEHAFAAAAATDTRPETPPRPPQSADAR